MEHPLPKHGKARLAIHLPFDELEFGDKPFHHPIETTNPLLLRVFKAQEKHPIMISIVIDGAPVSIVVAGLEDAEAALKLAQRIHSVYPTMKVTEQSQVKAKIRVSKK